MSGSLRAVCHLAAGRAVALPEPRREDRGCRAPDSLQTETMSLKAVARGKEADPWGIRVLKETLQMADGGQAGRSWGYRNLE